MDKWLHRISVALTVLGLFVSVYMTIFKFTENENMCLGNGGFSVVNSSIYAEVYGIPVAVIGVIGYAALLAVLLVETRNSFFAENGTLIIFGLALIGFLFTLYLIYVEIALIHALCPFCITSQITMTLFFIISVIRLVRQPSD